MEEGRIAVDAVRDLKPRLHLLGARAWAGGLGATELGRALVRFKVEQAHPVPFASMLRLMGQDPTTRRAIAIRY